METGHASQVASVQDDDVFVRPGMTAREIVQAVRNLKGVCLTSVSMRDAGQSDFKNRHRIYDLKTLAPLYNRMGLFSAECHGGARWHVGIMNRRESPFEEIQILRRLMPNVLLQTLVRETNLWGYRPYPRNVIEYAVAQVDIDVWRCFSFLNDVRNMRAVAEVVMKRGRLFEPAISFTVADWATDAYYLGVVREIVALAGGVDEIILCIKDMAGVGNPARISQLVTTIKEHYPDLLIHYHRHITDGLAIPALFAAAQSGAKIVDVQEDALVRFYGHPPILGVQAYFEEGGIHVHLNRMAAEQTNQQVREWIGHYEWAESPFKGYDHGVTKHRMPGGAFPSSFEQAEKGGFLHLMPAILRVMALYNQIVRYFDVTPGSQITWVTCSGIVNRYAKEQGESGVRRLIALLSKFVEEKGQDIEAMSEEEREELLQLFRNASGDFKNLLVGGYGRLPVGWPADWVYQSAFGDEWQAKIQGRTDRSPLDTLKDDDLDRLRQTLSEAIGRAPTEEEFILYLMHPKDALSFIEFRERYGMAPLVLPTDVWRNGLRRSGDKVDFELDGKPYCIELVSVGAEHEGVIHVVLKVNNVTRVYPVATPRARKAEIRMAKGPNEIGAPINGNVWRIGNPQRGPIHVGDVVHKGEEVANLEAMKMEHAILAPFSGRIAEVCIKLNDVVKEGQLLFVLEKNA
ncbi:biotin/lipoyl-containing protein [Roseiflexus castenholzii]|jgi:pyruvate carboxylase|uniref:Biotin/lipoyl attachment domain-containing protein n=1 Tax=Roseiflexus castenholzii (strain DSM 13941 / HLO8) TaxID=383372 RepID=A7NN81_ROSCS|nr:biotin/lipoyl-containing protein [Roseiflexus castenholzii]ABU59014.1 biotin/lipoyl attachment domain-containing protein [Roseiflexus castenholzii DSM 13941]